MILDKIISSISNFFSRGEFIDNDIDLDRYYIEKSPNVIHINYTLPSDYDINKKTIVIIDDNITMMSIINDDFKYLCSNDKITLCDFNVLEFSTNMAGFLYEDFMSLDNIKVDYAIMDITLNGSKLVNGTNIELDGVDLSIMTWKKFPDAKIIFYTGNTLNKYIKKIGIMRDKFKKFKGKSIDEFVIHKTNKSMYERREFFQEFLEG